MVHPESIIALEWLPLSSSNVMILELDDVDIIYLINDKMQIYSLTSKTKSITESST